MDREPSEKVRPTPAKTEAAPQPLVDPLAPPVIPDHALLRCIGRGSYGFVWLARNIMGVYRAVKIVYRNSFDNERPFERELEGIRRFEPISRSHDGFIDVLHIGINETQGYFYYVMELADDEAGVQELDPDRYVPKTLAGQVPGKGRLPIQICLQLGIALSHALAELNRHGLVHRDIKPANIIFVNGVPKLADIGLVADARLAHTYVGTEGYIPPEGPGTHQGDIYSLGKVLYEASTGEDRTEFPELPTDWDNQADHDACLELNEVVLQACQSAPDKRYHSALDMHADLIVLSNGKSVRRLKALERRLARLKRLLAMSALVALGLVAVLYPVYLRIQEANRVRQQQVGSSTAYGIRAMESGDFSGALPYFAQAMAIDQDNPSSQTTHRLRFGSALSQFPKLDWMDWETNEIRDVEFSPDGKKYLIAPRKGQTRVYDTETGVVQPGLFGPADGCQGAVFSPDSRQVAIASLEHNSATVWDLATGVKVLQLDHPTWVTCVRYDPTGRRIVTCDRDGLIRIWDWQHSSSPPIFLRGHTRMARFAGFSHDGRLIVSASEDGTARLWDAGTGAIIHVLDPHTPGQWEYYAAFSPDDSRVVTTCSDHRARIWDTRTGNRIPPDIQHIMGVTTAEFSPDGRFLLTTSNDSTARLWPLNHLELGGSSILFRHNAPVVKGGFSPDGRLIITACVDGSIRIWDLAAVSPPPPPSAYPLNEDGSRFVVATNGNALVCDTASNRPIAPTIALPPWARETGLSADGRFVLASCPLPEAGTTNLEFELIDAATGATRGPAVMLPGSPTNISVANGGKYFAVCGESSAQVWDTALGKVVFQVPSDPDEAVTGAKFNSDGSLLATRAGTRCRVWRMPGGQEAFRALDHEFEVHYTAFSSDGRYLVTTCSTTGLDPCSAQVWETATGRPVGSPMRHSDGVLFAAFSRDNRRLVTASEDFTAVVWDTATGKPLTPAMRDGNQIMAAEFSPDGRWVLTVSVNKTARLWSADTGEPLTPPLPHPRGLISGHFIASGEQIVTLDTESNWRVWKLPLEPMPFSTVSLLAETLSSETMGPTGNFTTQQAAALAAEWRQLHRATPGEDPDAENERIAAWHAFQAAESEAKNEWFAAAFHLRLLDHLRPNDPLTLRRLAEANTRLAERH